MAGTRIKLRVRRGKTPGFTLRELAVAMGIIAILMLLGLSWLKALRQRARDVTCVNNLRQINAALSIYKSMYRRYPRAAPDDFRPLAPLISDLSIFWCPNTESAVLSEEDLAGGTSYRYFAKPAYLAKKPGEVHARKRGHHANEDESDCWDHDKGHGNEPDGYDEDNPGRGNAKGRYRKRNSATESEDRPVFDPLDPLKNWTSRLGAVYDQSYSNHDGTINIVYIEDGHCEQVSME